MKIRYPIPVIDIFAGPGGLSEGFASVQDSQGQPAFEICLSIEKDKHAHSTLELRAFFHHLSRSSEPAQDYFRYLQGEESRKTLFENHPASAKYARSRAWHKSLSPRNRKCISRRINEALKPYSGKPWVLLGGPPCQAYSMVGRSRMRPVLGKKFEKDARHQLYKEYLSILKAHEPDVFVMENVKGLLSSQLQSQRIIELIFRDLRNAAGKGSYTLFSLIRRHREEQAEAQSDNNGYHLKATDFLIESEKYGIPQARHRVIIFGVRSDLLPRDSRFLPNLLVPSNKPVTVSRVLHGLPRLRSGRSKGLDSSEEWRRVLEEAIQAAWFKQLSGKAGSLAATKIRDVVSRLRSPQAGRGGRFYKTDRISIRYRPKWFLDSRLGGVCNHETRPHMDSDLHRYLFASSFARVHRRTVKLGGFPAELLPDHANVAKALRHGMFNDRFRVQVSTQPATTITCHLSKDGHYAIHYDPTQCRSLTVREAARLQTFPDNFFFEGPRTQQYVQVGNAVPPLLAVQIARIVQNTLQKLIGR